MEEIVGGVVASKSLIQRGDPVISSQLATKYQWSGGLYSLMALKASKMHPTRSILCLSLCLYGIRAPIRDSFRAGATYHAITTH